LTDAVTITVRRATADDQAGITALVRGARLNPRGLAWTAFVVAEDGGRLVGTAQLRPHADGALELASLVVDPGARGAGVATSLVDALLETERRPVHTVVDARYAGHFERWGFAPVAAGDLPRSIRRTLRVGRVVTGLASVVRRPPIRLVPLVRSAR
jgi:N-acetylglutamate synthase-like GNAT family acetyltransferase